MSKLRSILVNLSITSIWRSIINLRTQRRLFRGGIPIQLESLRLVFLCIWLFLFLFGFSFLLLGLFRCELLFIIGEFLLFNRKFLIMTITGICPFDVFYGICE